MTIERDCTPARRGARGGAGRAARVGATASADGRGDHMWALQPASTMWALQPVEGRGASGAWSSRGRQGECMVDANHGMGQNRPKSHPATSTSRSIEEKPIVKPAWELFFAVMVLVKRCSRSKFVLCLQG